MAEPIVLVGRDDESGYRIARRNTLVGETDQRIPVVGDQHLILRLTSTEIPRCTGEALLPVLSSVTRFPPRQTSTAAPRQDTAAFHLHPQTTPRQSSH
jgi:hypothetical protein